MPLSDVSDKKKSYPDIKFPIFYQLISLVLDNFIRLTNSLDIVIIPDFN